MLYDFRPDVQAVQEPLDEMVAGNVRNFEGMPFQGRLDAFQFFHPIH